MPKLSLRFTRSAIMLFFLATGLTFQSCKKKEPSKLGISLFRKTHNKVFLTFDDDEFAKVFKRVLDSEKTKMSNPLLISEYYDSLNYTPVYITAHLPNDDLKTLVTYYQKSWQHGLSPKIFQTDEIIGLLNKFYKFNSIKNKADAYRTMAELEMLTANSLINYADILQYGIITPKKIYSRYFTYTRRPDSASILHTLYVKDIKAFLDSIQPKDPQYIAMQKALVNGTQLDGMTTEQTRRLLLISLERLRWKK